MSEEEVEEEEEEEKLARKLSISLPASLVETVEEYAEEKDLKRSQVVRKALKQFFEESEEPDLWEDGVSDKLKRIETMQKAILKKIGAEETELDVRRPKGAIKSSESERKIEELIKDCGAPDGFEIEDDYGFKALCQERRLVDDIWTEERLKMIAPYLKIGYVGYFMRPERKSFIDECAKAMELDEEQKDILSEEFEKLLPREEY